MPNPSSAAGTCCGSETQVDLLSVIRARLGNDGALGGTHNVSGLLIKSESKLPERPAVLVMRASQSMAACRNFLDKRGRANQCKDPARSAFLRMPPTLVAASVVG